MFDFMIDFYDGKCGNKKNRGTQKATLFLPLNWNVHEKLEQDFNAYVSIHDYYLSMTIINKILFHSQTCFII